LWYHWGRYFKRMENIRMVDAMDAVEQRRRLLRGVLLAIIIGTIPFYCLGFWLWGTARPVQGGRDRTPQATITTIGAGTPSRTPTVLVTSTLNPTSTLFQIPTSSNGGGGFPVPTAFIPTAFFPTSTIAPSFTPFPTNTIPPSTTPFPTNTLPPLEPATNTPFPSNTPTIFILPTDPPLNPATDTPNAPLDLPTVPVTIVSGGS
jgi:hypothetical protein